MAKKRCLGWGLLLLAALVIWACESGDGNNPGGTTTPPGDGDSTSTDPGLNNNNNNGTDPGLNYNNNNGTDPGPNNNNNNGTDPGPNNNNNNGTDTGHTPIEPGPTTGGAEPVINGFFVQPSLGYGAIDYQSFNTQAAYDNWMRAMADVGGEMLFYQWTVHYQHEQTWFSDVWGGDASADFAFYDAAPNTMKGISVRSWANPTTWPGTPSQGGKETVDYLLDAGANTGVKVWLGLYLNESPQSYSWWDAVNDNTLSAADMEIIDYHRERSVSVLNELCDQYGTHPALGGFYYSVEVANLGFMDPSSWPVLAQLLDDVAQAAHNCHGKQLAISPFFNVALTTPQEYADMWDYALAHSGLDIVLLQDGAGVEPHQLTESVDNISPWYEALEKVVRKHQRHFWGNVELFTNDGTRESVSLRPSSIGSIQRQLNAVAPYVDKFVCFDFHSMDPNSTASDAAQRQQLYNDYRTYLQNR